MTIRSRNRFRLSLGLLVAACATSQAKWTAPIAMQPDERDDVVYFSSGLTLTIGRLDGTVLSENKLEGKILSLRPAPGGNAFASCGSRLYEINPQGEEVWKLDFKSGPGQICSVYTADCLPRDRLLVWCVYRPKDALPGDDPSMDVPAIAEIDRRGKVDRILQWTEGAIRSVHPSRDGKILLTMETGAHEVDWDGKKVLSLACEEGHEYLDAIETDGKNFLVGSTYSTVTRKTRKGDISLTNSQVARVGRSGSIGWRCFPAYPVSLQVLPNGNLLVGGVSNGEATEWDRRGRVVRFYKEGRGPFHAAGPILRTRPVVRTGDEDPEKVAKDLIRQGLFR